VAVGGEKGVKDHVALAGGLEPLGRDKLSEYLFLGALQGPPQLKVIFTLYIFQAVVNPIFHPESAFLIRSLLFSKTIPDCEGNSFTPI